MLILTLMIWKLEQSREVEGLWERSGKDSPPQGSVD